MDNGRIITIEGEAAERLPLPMLAQTIMRGYNKNAVMIVSMGNDGIDIGGTSIKKFPMDLFKACKDATVEAIAAEVQKWGQEHPPEKEG